MEMTEETLAVAEHSLWMGGKSEEIGKKRAKERRLSEMEIFMRFQHKKEEEKNRKNPHSFLSLE